MSLLKTLTGHTGSVLAVTIVKGVQGEGDLIISGGEENTIRIWDVNGSLIKKFILTVTSVCALGVLDDGQGGRSIIAAYPNGGVQVIDMITGEHLITLRHRGLRAMVISDERRIIATGGLEGNITLRDHHTGNIINAGGLTDVYALAIITDVDNSRVVSVGGIVYSR